MKKILALLLSLTLVVGLAACRTEEPDPDDPDPDPDPGIDPDDPDTLFIGTPEFSGEFINWGTSSAYDVAIRELTLGSGLIATDKEGAFLVNENIVENVDEVEETMEELVDEGEDKTYTFEIRDDLEFSDGEPITAHDYAFGIKMQAAYSIAQAGHASPTGGDDLVGYEAFREGETTEFEGINVVDDYTIELTIDGENLPYFYELAMVSASPQPKHLYTDDGEYDFLTAEEHEELGDDDTHIGEHIAQYISTVPVSSGPYVLEEYRADQFVRLSLNENFAGDFRGHTPTIENVVVRVVPSATDIEHLLNEEIHILSGVVEGDKIDRALDADHIQSIYYDRIGFGGLYMHTDFGPTEDHLVRQAIAYMVNREEFVEVFLEGYGTLIDAPLGIGQWMVQESDKIPDELTGYYPDMDKANELLDEAGWYYDDDGDSREGEFDYWEDNYRHNDDGEVLYLGWMGTESDFSDILAVYLTGAMDEAGVDFYATQAGFDVLLDNYYFGFEMEDDERDFHMFNLATSYTPLYDPYYSYHSDFLETSFNVHQFEDSPANPQADFSEQVGHDFSWDPTEDEGMTVDELLETMRRLPATDTDQFLEYWEALMLRMNRLLPVLPLYSNQYYHFAHTDLEGFEITGFWDWQQNIVDLEFTD